MVILLLISTYLLLYTHFNKKSRVILLHIIIWLILEFFCEYVMKLKITKCRKSISHKKITQEVEDFLSDESTRYSGGLEESFEFIFPFVAIPPFIPIRWQEFGDFDCLQPRNTRCML